MLMSKFGYCSNDILLKLFLSYCTSFYGSPLWSIGKLDALCLAWRKCIKKIYKLNPRTRSKYVGLLVPNDIIPLLAWRQVSFFISCVNSSNDLLRHVSENVCGEFVHSLSIIVHMCNVPFDSIYNVAFRIFFKERLSVYTTDQVNVDVIAEACILKELCDMRDGLEFCEIDISIDLFLTFFTV